jgi:uncharacterized protein YjgD (DUF1641 family)
MAINIPIITTFSDKGINAAQKAFKGLGSSLPLVGAAIAGAVTGVGVLAYKSVQAASDLEEALSKNRVVFGAISVEVAAFAREANRAFGISETAALKAAGTFAVFGKSAGLAGKDLQVFATDFVALSADMASFSNTTVDEAINAIGSALRGEAEPLRKYGVLLNDATLKAAATELGIYRGTAALTAQQKVLAAQKVIYEQTTDAQGDFARTSDGLANQQKILSATLENVKTNIGQALLPIFVKFVRFLNDNVTPVIERVARVLGEDGIVKGLQQAIYEMGDFGPKFLGALKSVTVGVATMVNNLAKAGKVIATLAKNPLTGWFRLGDALKDVINVGDIKSAFDGFASGVRNFGSASGYSSFAAKQLAETAKSAADGLGEFGDVAGGSGGAADKTKKMADRIKELRDEIDKTFTTSLKEAQENLKDAQKSFDDFAENVSGSIKDAFDFGSAQEAGKETGKGFLSGLKDQVAGIVTYANNVEILLKRGLSQDALAAVLDAGGDAGAAIAQELVNGAQDLITGPGGVNELTATAEAAANTIGQMAASKWYQAGVDQGKAMVQGIVDVMAKYAPIIANQNLKPKKLAGLLENIKTDTAFSGIMASNGMTAANETYSPGQISSTDLSKIGLQAAAGDTYVVNLSSLVPNAAAGEAIVNAIRSYNRAAGPANIQVA